ncbi:hypothetical protein CDG81_00600 [Actinopolyspora erythraea]|uniref:Uncharacterized protein n=1 Tax=Actinopolyspora erythraea TaxID=414996 RepID=A0A099DCR7_9ACTN|nr:hypothetical protein [Actinopolyspora erythraea]ASU77073.1 hypothetical protein CDG81_00600 [Actinopolyspora erythraea]KGI83245.1 hypothetical protein IL38_01085 [Actinopolyspora erythraea]
MTAASTLGPALLHQPLGLLWLIGTVLALAVGSALAPLRGGHGEHADAGPGALTVAGLLARQPSSDSAKHHDGSATENSTPGVSCGPVPQGSLLERATIVLHGPDRSPDSDWWHTLGHRPDPNPTPAEKLALLNHPDYQPPTASRQRPRHPTSLTEDDLTRLLNLPEVPEQAPESGYIGKHRLEAIPSRSAAVNPKWTGLGDSGEGCEVSHIGEPSPYREWLVAA